MDKTGKLQLADQGIDNLTNLVELSDQSLLSNLQIRYSQKLIYTYIGSILISINPYTELGIYDKKRIISYQNKSLQDMPPHLFGIGEINYSKMMLENENQVIVISGESGAGKTESFKRLLAYFAYVSGGFKEKKQSADELSNDIATRILDSTPLLESFGNAQTIRNDNSSRFGKYVEIFFDNGNICGSRITNYLLEKSRIVNISSRERGYHIFYEILLGLDSFNKSQYNFKEIKDYSYLNCSKDYTIKDRNDATNLKEFMKQWDSLGLSSEDLDVTMRILSAVLHLGNIKFMEEQEVSYLVETGNIGVVAKMLQVDLESLKQCLTMKTTETVKDAASSPLNKEQSINYRDTLAKHLYSELFNWIVTKVNTALNSNNNSNLLARRASVVDRSLLSSTSKFRCIAMLDIYGFENFPENSLEQLCINYANETLQQFFNRYVFELEQQEYKQEGISWHYISYPDNQPIIDLLSSKPNGIIQILNDECSIPQGSDEAFLNKCHNVHSKNSNYEKPKKVHPPQFIIHHFAGNISYSVHGFLEKNRDVLRKEILGVIENCGVDEIAMMFRKRKELQMKNPIAKARTPAVMGDFQNSLTTLLTKMKTCQPWFIRCLKPNATKEALKFNKDIVMDQMKYTGILETVKIRKSGFPIRISFNVFLSRFYLLVTKEIRKASQGDQQEACLKLMLKFKGTQKKHFEIGKTKLFLKEEFARHLEKQVQIIRNRSAIIIQRNWRAYWKIRQIVIQNEAATKIQAAVRGFLDRRRIKKLQEGIVKLQSYVRMQIIRKKFLEAHPEFSKFSVFQRTTKEIPENDQSKLITYKNPESKPPKKSKRNKKKTTNSPYNYDLLKIPIELAFLLDKSSEKLNQDNLIPLADQVVQTGRAQHLWNRGEYKLPNDIDEYLLENYLDENGNDIAFESKSKPITIPYLNEIDTNDLKDEALTAHKLILRILYAKSMPWFHRFLTNSYLQYLGTKSQKLQNEIFVQILAETLPSKTIKSKFQSDNEEIRLSRAWTLLGNFLSFIVPSQDIYNYILKCVSDCSGVDQAVTCQEKLLHFISAGLPQIPRIFPATTLESSANKKGSKTCLNIIHPDNKSNSVHLNSFTIAEDLASHSLCFRMKKYTLIKGWSLSLIFQDVVYDCSGQNYILDIISGLELPQQWTDITGQTLEKKFLISRRNKVFGDATDNSSRAFIKNPYKAPKTSYNKVASTVNSLHSMDSWVEKVFDSSFTHEDTSNIQMQDFIHGLEDDLKAQKKIQFSSNPNITAGFSGPVNGYGSNPNLAFSGPNNLQYQSDYHLPRQNVNTMYFPAGSITDYEMSPDPSYLQEQLNTVQLENQVIQSSIEREILQSRLQKIKQQKYYQQPGLNQNFPVTYQQQFQPVPTFSIPTNMNRYQMYPQFNQPSYPYQYMNNDSFSNSVQLSHNIPNNQIQPVPNINISLPDDNQFSLNPQIINSDTKNIKNKVSDDTMNKPKISEIDLHNIKLKPISNTAPPPPSGPPPPPPGQTSISDTQDSEKSQDNKNRKVRKRQSSIVKYSEIGNPSTTVVNDKDILPEIKVQGDKKSYLRAAEVPKVDVTNRAAFLENFFKDKQPISDKSLAPPKKRKAPTTPIVDKSFPENQSNAIDLMTSMNSQSKLLPRPSMFGKELSETTEKFIKSKQVSIKDQPDEVIYESLLPRTNLNTNKTENIPVALPRRNTKNEKNLKVPVKVKRFVSNTKADILCGLPDMRYFTYQKTPWFLLLKREIYLPNEIQNTTILNPMIFCQIVRDLIEFPCIRWIGNEKQKLMSILGNQVTKDINSILAISTNVMLKVIDEALKCELYFSRFYEIQWPTYSDNESICHWMAISHTGIRFVQQNIKMSSESSLAIAEHIFYQNIAKISKKNVDQYNNPQMLIITTKSRKKFKVKTIHAASAHSLILEFSKQQETEKTHGTINLSSNYDNIKRKRSLIQDNKLFTDSRTTMLGVNNQRIHMDDVKSTNNNNNDYEILNKDDNINNKPFPPANKQRNLIDFTMNYSKHKNYQHISNVILRYQRECITEPILQFSNEAIYRQAIEVYGFLLQLSEEDLSDRNSKPILSANLVFKMLLQNEKLNEEIILQIFKQINGNPMINARNYLWNLLSIIIIFIGPTKEIQPFLMEHLNQIVNNPNNQDKHMAAYAMKNCKIFSRCGARKELPTENDFELIMKGNRESDVKVCVLQESTNFSVSFNSQVEDVVKMICEEINVSSKLEITEYALVVYEMDKNNIPVRVNKYFPLNDFFFDIYNLQFKQTSRNYMLRFCRISWEAPLDLDSRSQNFIAFHFNQLSKDILNYDWLIPNTNQSIGSSESATIAKIAYYNMRGQGLQKLKNDETLKSLLPSRLFDKKKIVSKKSIMKSMNSESDDKNIIDLAEFQKLFLELLEKLPKYGNIKYPVNGVKQIKKPGHYFINFNPKSISLIDDDCQEIIKFLVSELKSFTMSLEDINKALFNIQYKNNEELNFHSVNGTEINYLLNLYQLRKSIQFH